MNFEDIIYDTQMILSKSNKTNDFRVEDMHLASLLNNYRALMIGQEYDVTMHINPLWIQPIRNLLTTQVNTADDSTMLAQSICLAKVTLPPVVSMPDDLGVRRLTLGAKQKNIYETSPEELYGMIELNDPLLDVYNFYFKKELSYFIYPYVETVGADLILANPLDGKIVQTEYVLSGNLTVGQEYKVYGGDINYNSTIYNVGDTFTCIAGYITYTGFGIVKNTMEARIRDIRDNYPCDRAMANKMIIAVLTQEFQIEIKQVSDIVNDSQDQFKIVSSQ